MVEFTEEHGSPIETISENRRRLVRHLRCPWEARYELADQLLYSQWGETGMICTSIDIEPAPGANLGAGSVASYDFARCTATYELLEDFTEEFEPTSESIVLPADNFVWYSGSTIHPDEAPTKSIFSMEYIITVNRQRFVPAEALNFVDSVNATAIRPGSAGLGDLLFQPQTLLYRPPKIRRLVTTGNYGLWNVTYRFVYKPNWYKDGNEWVARGWNYFLRRTSNGDLGYEQIYRFNDPYTPVQVYRTEDFLRLGLFVKADI